MKAAYPIAGGALSGGGSATKALKAALSPLGLEGAILRRAMVAAYEAEMNAVIHANGGVMEVALSREALEVLIRDSGPGIPDIAQALVEGFSTAPPEAREMGFGAGMGLPNILKNTDRLSIHSEAGRGAEVRFLIYLVPAPALHAERLAPPINTAACIHCFRCIHACPTQAIRCPENDLRVLDHLCIACQTCAEVCPTGVFSPPQSAPEPPPVTRGALYLPSPFLAQFGAAYPPAVILRLLEDLGYGPIYCSHHWEEALLQEAARYQAANADHPCVIAPVCPAVVLLIRTRFPSLIPCLAPYAAPEEALRARFTQGDLTVLPACPAQKALWKTPGALAQIHTIPPAALLEAVSQALPQPDQVPPPTSSTVARPAAFPMILTGMRPVQQLLEGLETDRYTFKGVIAPYACDGGCFGAACWPEFHAIARGRLLQSAIPAPEAAPLPTSLRRPREYAPRPGMRLEASIGLAIQKLGDIDRFHHTLPGRDCARCGAPTCLAHAEDHILGRSHSPCPYAENTGAPRRDKGITSAVR